MEIPLRGETTYHSDDYSLLCSFHTEEANPPPARFACLSLIPIDGIGEPRASRIMRRQIAQKQAETRVRGWKRRRDAGRAH